MSVACIYSSANLCVDMKKSQVYRLKALLLLLTKLSDSKVFAMALGTKPGTRPHDSLLFFLQFKHSC